MTLLLPILGATFVALVLWDVFHTLYHPSGHGPLTRTLLRTTWRLSARAPGPGRTTLAGPLGVIVVVGSWGALVVLGFALIYLPNVSSGFLVSPGTDAVARSDALDALYVSLVTLATLGFGDIVPTAWWLRLVVPLQGLVGFILLTAAVSWILQIYPALSRRRALAGRVAVLSRAELAEQLPELGSTLPAPLLEGLAAALVSLRVDLTQYALSYYFREDDPALSVAAMVTYLERLAVAGGHSPASDVRLAAHVLEHALDDLAQLLDREFLHVGGPTSQVIRAFAADHGHEAA